MTTNQIALNEFDKAHKHNLLVQDKKDIIAELKAKGELYNEAMKTVGKFGGKLHL